MPDAGTSYWGGSPYGHRQVKKVSSDTRDEVMCPTTAKEPRWMLKSELKQHFSRIEHPFGTLEQNMGGIPLYSDGRETYLNHNENHTLIIAPTNSHKTRSELMPGVELLSLSNESGVVHDPKGEIYKRFAVRLIRRGYNVKVLNFRDPDCSDCWNLFHIIYSFWMSGNKDRAKECLRVLASVLIPIKSTDPFWDLSGRAVLFGLMNVMMELARDENEVNMANLINLVNEATINTDLFDEMLDRIDDKDSIKSHLAIASKNADTTKRCIMGTVNNALSIFASSASIMKMMGKNDIDLGSVGDTPTFIFVITPDESNAYNGIVSIFVTQLYQSLIDRAQSSGGRLVVRVNFLLDEFASLGTIEDFPNMLSACRSRNIRFVLVVQSVSQLQSAYPKDATTIMDNCADWIFLGGRDDKFIDLVLGFHGNILTKTQLASLPKGEAAYVWSGRCDPFIAKITDIDSYCIDEFEFRDPPLVEGREMPKIRKNWTGDENEEGTLPVEPNPPARRRLDEMIWKDIFKQTIGPNTGNKDAITISILFDEMYAVNSNPEDMEPVIDLAGYLSSQVPLKKVVQDIERIEDDDFGRIVNKLPLKSNADKGWVVFDLKRIKSLIEELKGSSDIEDVRKDEDSDDEELTAMDGIERIGEEASIIGVFINIFGKDPAPDTIERVLSIKEYLGEDVNFMRLLCDLHYFSARKLSSIVDGLPIKEGISKRAVKQKLEIIRILTL